ncbi:MAG: glycosyltransferase family 9 protein [Leptospirales bacterium]
MNKVLFVGLRTLGDMILTMPALQSVHDACPDSQIDYLMERPFAALFSEEPMIRKVITLPRHLSSSSDSPFMSKVKYFKFLQSIRAEQYDVVFDLFSRGPRSRVIVAVSNARRRVGIMDHPVPMVDSWIYTDRVRIPNALTQMFDQIQYVTGRLGFQSRKPLPAMTVHPENTLKARSLLGSFPPEGSKGFLVVLPGSGMNNKNWPAASFSEVIRHLIQRGVAVLLMGGPNDHQAVAEVVQRFPAENPFFKWIVQSDLPTLKGVFSLSLGVLGNDSGPLHLAQAVGKKIVALFGPGDHVSYRPFNGALVRKGLACSPCQSFASRCPDNQCMKSITVGEVLCELQEQEMLLS